MFKDSEKQAIWQMIRSLNETWTKGNAVDLARFFHKRMMAFSASDNEYRLGRENCIKGWKDFADHVSILSWEEKKPHIEIFGNSAVVAYYYEITCDMNEKIQSFSGRDMFFLIQEDGQWWVAADHFSSFPE